MKKVQIKHLPTDGPLHPLYSGQEQPAFVCLRLDTGEVETYYQDDDSLPSDVWHGIERRWAISENLTAREINRLLDEIAPLAQRLLDAGEVIWDGSNWRGRAKEGKEDEFFQTEEEIAPMAENAQTESLGCWSAYEWFAQDSEYEAELREKLRTLDDAGVAEIIGELEEAVAEADATVTDIDAYVYAVRESVRTA